MVVGCGPVGALLALMLGQRGVRVIVIDREAAVFPLPRAIAFDSDAFRILQSAGIQAEDFANVRVPRICLRSPWFGVLADANTAFDRDTHPVQSTFHQPALEEVLRARLHALGDLVDLRPETALIGYEERADSVLARLLGPEGEYAVRLNYLVGCDGAHSSVRQAAAIGFEGRSYDDDWLVIDADNAEEGIDHVEFLCDPSRPTPHMLAPLGGRRWEFRLRRGEVRAEMEGDAAIDRLLAPWGGLATIRIHRRAVYRFQARSASTYRKGRIMIAGDAAHVTPPFVGQGLISGLRDCHNLAWKLAAVVKGQAGDGILDSYDAERQPHARAMIDFARWIGLVVVPPGKLAGIAVHALLGAGRLLPPVRRYLDRMGMRPSGRFRRGLFLRGSRRGGVKAGYTFPQIWLQPPQGGRTRSDDAFGPGPVCLGYGIDPSLVFDHESTDRAARLQATLVAVFPKGQTAAGGVYVDAEDTLAQLVPPGTIVLLRPDRVIWGVGKAADAPALLLGVERLMRTGTAGDRR